MLNIFGAVLGAILAGFYLPIAIGVNRVVFVAVGINWLIGVGALYLSRQWPPMRIDSSHDHQQRRPVRWPSPLLVATAAISGFGCLALEVIFVRILAQRSDGSVYIFALMLVIFLLCLAAGAGVVSRWLDRIAPWQFLAWTQLAATTFILISTTTFQFLPFLAMISPADTYTTRTAKLASASLLILGPPILLIGVVLPWTWKMASRDVDDVGRSVGVLTGINTVAAVCGSLVAGFLLLPALGLGGSSLLVAALYGVLAIIGFWQSSAGLRRWIAIGACIVVPVSWYAAGLWRPVYQPLEAGEKLVSYRDTADGSIAVIQRTDGHRVLKLNHEYTLGSSSAGEREIRQGRLPLMLHPMPRRVAFIGAATGITASAALDFPVDRVTAIELVPGVADALPMFQQWNAAFYNDPRVEMIVDDGRNFLLGTRDEFDVVVSDLFVPWHAGTGDLYTVEHFHTVRRHLAPGGIFAQWLPAYQVTVDELRIITASFLMAFPSSTLWRDDFRPHFPLLCLVGFRDELKIDPHAIAESRQRLAKSKSWRDKLLESPGGLELLFACGDTALRKWVQGADLNTDNHPIIEYVAPISFVQHRQEENVGPILNLLASFRPRVWSYPQLPTTGLAIEDAFRAADLMHDAMVAGASNDFEGESRLLLELESEIDKIPVVATHLTHAAARYQNRNLSERGEQLLSAIVRHESAPVEALTAMAAVQKRAGNVEQASSLLERAVERSPETVPTRRQLVDLLTDRELFDRVEPHLLVLLDTAPNDPYLRLDLARALDRQGKFDAARAQIDEFRARWDGTNGPAVWRYLRTLGLGTYIDSDQVGPGPVVTDPAEETISQP
jgi:predicted membrane-bound spermidine synthase